MDEKNITEQAAAITGAQGGKARRKIHKRLIVEFIEKLERRQLEAEKNERAEIIK